MKKIPILFKNQFENEEQAKAVMKLSGPNIVKIGILTTGFIAIFELLLLARVWLLGLGSEVRNLQYTCCYIILLFMSLMMVIHLNSWGKDCEKRYLSIYRAQIIYSFCIMVWGVVITILDSTYHNKAEVVVYMSILVALPMITFQNPFVIVSLQVIGDIIVLINVIRIGTFGDVINFFAYSVTSIIASVAFQSTKKKLYIKQYELSERAIKDPLTKIYNRQMLHENGMKIWGKAMDANTPISVIMGDVDYFKKINDKYGHAVGDKCIASVAKACMDVCTQPEYTCYRYGGEEFVIMLEGVTAIDAVLVAEKLMKNIESIEIEKYDDIHLSMSLGVYTGVPTENDSFERFVCKADNLMYQSKTNGRNQYTVAM